MSEFESTRHDWVHAMEALAGQCRQRLTVSDADLDQSQTDRLHELLASARAHSLRHRERLAGIDSGAVTSTDLSTLPTMTESDLMANWDDVVTDSELTLEVAQRHLDELHRTEQFSFCLGRYVVVASGGSTGQRGVFAYDRDALAGNAAPNLAHLTVRQELLGMSPPSAPPVQARVTARAPTHLSTAVSAIITGGPVQAVQVPATLPIPEMVGRLNEARPDLLMSYPSALHRLAVEALDGNLQIELGETILPGDTMLHVGDTTIIEPVDEANRPIAPGERSAKVLLTNLHNHLQPLIRYELTDEVTEHTGPRPLPWSGRWIEPPIGRMDDWFAYGSAQVHPHLFRSRLGEDEAVVEYQVLQTDRGATVRIVATADVRSEQLARRLEDDLASHGVDDPRVTIEVVDGIDRHASTGKLKRFVPIGPT